MAPVVRHCGFARGVISNRDTLDNRHTRRGASLNLPREAEARGVEQHRRLARRSPFATEHQHQNVQELCEARARVTTAMVPNLSTPAVATELRLTRRVIYLSIPLDTSGRPRYPDLVTAKDLQRILRSFGCVESRQRGSHLRIECGQCVTTVPVHAGEDIGPGLLRRIERDLEPCLGKGWLKKP